MCAVLVRSQQVAQVALDFEGESVAFEGIQTNEKKRRLAGGHSVGVLSNCSALVMQHSAAGKMSGTGAEVGRCNDFIILQDLCRVLLNLAVHSRLELLVCRNSGQLQIWNA